MKRRKILINAGMITKESAGVGVYSLELLKELVPMLQSEGFDCTIYCYAPELIQSLNIGAVKKISLGYLLDTLLKNVTIHRHIWNIIFLNFISKRYHVLYSFSSHGNLLHPKQIVTLHDVISLNFPNSYKSQYYYFKYFMPILLRQTKRIISISAFTKKEVMKRYSLIDEKVSVIYNGVNHLEELNWSEKDEEWLKEITEGKRYCICVGASYKHKNIETLLTVCKRMKKHNAMFLIVSKPNAYYNSLREKAREMHLANVSFLPFISASRLALAYKMARLNIYLTLYEGFGFPPAEASFFKTQTLLSDHPALVEVYGNQGCFEFTNPFDLDEIERIVKKYLVAEEKLENTSYCKLKETYNWKKSAEQTLLVIKNI